MVDRFRDSFAIIKYCFTAIIKWPVLITPLLFCWALYAPLVLYIKFGLKTKGMPVMTQLGISFIIICILSFILSISCLWVLELMRQIEIKGRVNLFEAFFNLLVRDVIRALPIMILWAFIWFILFVLSVIFSKKHNDDDNNQSLTAESAAETLMGTNNISFSGAFFSAVEKAVRMIVFLIYPAIAWEGRNSFDAIKRGMQILKGHLKKFVGGYILTEVAAALVYLPAAILYEIHSRLHVQYPDWVWVTILIYLAFAWSLSMLLEQLYTADLYTWNAKWEHECRKIKHAKGPKAKLPSLSKVKPPSLLDDTPDMKFFKR